MLTNSGPLFTKRVEALPQNVVKTRVREIGYYNDRNALKFDRHLGSAAAKVPEKLQSDWKCLISNLAASGLHKIVR